MMSADFWNRPFLKWFSNFWKGFFWLLSWLFSSTLFARGAFGHRNFFLMSTQNKCQVKRKWIHETVQTHCRGCASVLNAGEVVGPFSGTLKKFKKISTFSKLSAKFRQNFIKIWAKITENKSKITKFLRNFAKKCEKKNERKISEILRSERCKSM